MGYLPNKKVGLVCWIVVVFSWQIDQIIYVFFWPGVHRKRWQSCSWDDFSQPPAEKMKSTLRRTEASLCISNWPPKKKIQTPHQVHLWQSDSSIFNFSRYFRKVLKENNEKFSRWNPVDVKDRQTEYTSQIVFRRNRTCQGNFLGMFPSNLTKKKMEESCCM